MRGTAWKAQKIKRVANLRFSSLLRCFHLTLLWNIPWFFCAALLSWLSGRLSFRYPRMVIPKWRSVLLASGDRAYCLLVSQDTHMHAPNLEICKCFHGDAAYELWKKRRWKQPYPWKQNKRNINYSADYFQFPRAIDVISGANMLIACRNLVCVCLLSSGQKMRIGS